MPRDPNVKHARRSDCVELTMAATQILAAHVAKGVQIDDARIENAAMIVLKLYDKVFEKL
jgi:hypothetical protein